MRFSSYSLEKLRRESAFQQPFTRRVVRFPVASRFSGMNVSLPVPPNDDINEKNIRISDSHWVDLS